MDVAEKIIRDLADAGVRLEVRQGILYGKPRAAITPELRQAVQERREEIIAAMAWDTAKAHRLYAETSAVISEFLAKVPSRFLSDGEREQWESVWTRQDYGELHWHLARWRKRARLMFQKRFAPQSHDQPQRSAPEPEPERQALAEEVGRFIDRECVVGRVEWVTSRGLYDAYAAWCRGRGFRPQSQPEFSKEIKKLGFGAERAGSNIAVRIGIGLKNAQDPLRLKAAEGKKNSLTPIFCQVMREFLAEECVTGQGLSVAASSLYEAHDAYAERIGEGCFREEFFEGYMDLWGYKAVQDEDGGLIWLGITLRRPHEPAANASDDGEGVAA